MISFSGIDCSGKSTQIELLEKHLNKKNIPYQVIWSRGGYTPGIEFVKRVIRRGRQSTKEERIANSEQVNSDSKKRRVLFIASLIDLWFYYSIVLRIKGINKLILCDRYIWDTYIDFKMKYPEYRFEKGFWWNLTLKTMVKPSPSFCFFISAEESMRRSELKEEPFPEPVEVREERINWYLKELKHNRWDNKIDATKPINIVFADVRNAIYGNKKQNRTKKNYKQRL